MRYTARTDNSPEIAHLRDLLNRAYRGGAWHGPSLRSALRGVTAALAAARVSDQVHCIWEIVHHLAAWNGAVAARLQGRSLRTPPEGDWPPVLPGDNKAWNKALTWLEKSHSHLLITLGTLEEAELDRRVGRNSLRENLLGTLQHYAYHAGQIVVLKKRLGRNAQ